MVNPAEIDDTEQAIARVRRFRSSHLDRLHKNGRLSWRQFYACDWYRNLHHRGRFGLQVVASYGERTTGGEIGYGLPRTEAQLNARRQFMEARKEWPLSMQGFMDRFLIQDDMRSEEHTSELQSLMRISYAVFCLKKKKTIKVNTNKNAKYTNNIDTKKHS